MSGLLEHFAEKLASAVDMGPSLKVLAGSKSTDVSEAFKLAQNYDPTLHNCTTICVAPVRGTFPELHPDTDMQLRGLGVLEKGALNVQGGRPSGVFMPQDLGAALDTDVKNGVATKTNY